MKNLFKKAVFKKHPLSKNGPYARFDIEYMRKVKAYCKVKKASGMLNGFMDAKLESYGKSINKDGDVFINKTSLEFILKEIRYFKKNGRWKIVE